VVVAEASGSIAGVMTVAHHDKLDGIETSATADQTKGDIEGLAIQTVGAVTSGTWTSTDVGIAYGGTGQSTAADAFGALKQAASTSATGVVELALTTEALAGTDTSRAVTAAGLAARSYRTAIGDASATAYVVTHSLGTRDVNVQLYDASSYETVYAQVVRTTTAAVTITFNAAPASNDVIVMVNKIQ
jgi:hypothetical protein